MTDEVEAKCASYFEQRFGKKPNGALQRGDDFSGIVYKHFSDIWPKTIHDKTHVAAAKGFVPDLLARILHEGVMCFAAALAGGARG